MSQARSYSERLMLAQHRAGMNQSQLAERAGVSVATVSRAIAGTFVPKIETTMKLAMAAGVDAKWLAFGDDEKGGAE